MAKNKKGSIEDLIYILVVLTAGAIIILVGGKFVNMFNTQVQGMDVVPDDAKTSVNTVNDMYAGTIDTSFMLLTIGLCIAALILAMLVVVHPIFFVFYFIILPIIIYVGGICSNIYQTAAETTPLSDIASNLIFLSAVCQYLPYIISVLGLLLAIIMYKTWQNRT